MSARQPVLFVSHGAPDLVLDPGVTGRLWSDIGRRLPIPEAILVISAHWESAQLSVSAAAHPETMHDFGGFPRSMYAIQYPAPGAVNLAGRIAALLEVGGLATRIDHLRGLDHGAWVPLKFIYPAADIPVSQLSIHPRAGPAWHRNLGALLRPLRDEGVLILATGAVTHNFGWLSAPGSPAYPDAVDFSNWLERALAAGAEADLLAYRTRSRFGAEAHPTEEHLMPLFVAWGAADDGDRILRLNQEFTYGGLAMDAYLWQPADQPMLTQKELLHGAV